MKIPIHVTSESREPIYHQVKSQIITLIAGGKLKPGTPLPSIRSLASDLGCSVITTRRAYQDLEAGGYIKTVQGKGTFVREMENMIKEETKHKVVYDALDKAVEQGMQFGFEKEELNVIFTDVVKKNYENGG